MAARKLSQEIQKLRNEHNRDLVRRMRSGDSLTSFDSRSSWYPPRPTIEKDATAIERLYGTVTATGEGRSEKAIPEMAGKMPMRLVQ